MRRLAAIALGLSGLLCLVTPSSGQARPPIKVGLLLPYTGVIAINGQETSKGVEFYFAKVGNKVGGREIQLVKEDDEAKPDVGLTKTRKLIERDRADVLIGPVHSGVALAIRDYVHAQGVPLIVPVAFTRDLTAPGKASPWLFRVVETTDQGNFAMGTWVVKKTPHRKIVVMASDFVAGRHSVEAFIAAFRAAGGEIVKEIYAPLNTPDFAPYMAQVAGLTADAVYAWFAGTDSIRFVKAYREYGLTGRLPLLAYNTLTDDVLLPTLGDAALGIVSVGHYSAALDTPENRAFVREYETRYNAWPTRYVELGYVSAQLVGAAVEALKGEVSDKADFRDAIRNAATKIQPPRGPIRFDRYQQVITDVYVMKVERQGNRLVNAIVDRIANTSQEESWKWWNK
ncbi:MAG: ABC transporter substrate-binding protein [Candidatus Rokuibacteriota bacterium]|nr:MAG: ABC transporter substrate-binding protein [Candidatus Rokubacteria bacterium]